MMKQSRRNRGVRLLIALLVLAALPLGSNPALAALRVERVLSSNNADFVRGRFSLTGLVAEGGIQLLPLTTVNQVRTGPPPLCQPLAEMATAAYSTTAIVSGTLRQTTYFYTIGGRTNGFVPVDQTCHTHILNSSGNTQPWTFDTPRLPRPVRFNKAIAVHGLAGQGFLYSLGGATGNLELSQSAIYRTQINPVDGSIGAWITDTVTLPLGQGRHAFSLVNYRTPTGSNYLYLFGGIRRTLSGFAVVVDAKRDAWKIEIMPDGSLDTVNGWQPLNDIPIRPSIAACAGLYDSQAVSFPVYNTVGNTTVSTETMYLIGGQYLGPNCGVSPANPSADVYRATILQDGSLSWDTNPALPSSDPDYNLYTLPTPLYGHRAAGFNQKIYVLGGYDVNNFPAPGPIQKIYASFADQDQDLVTVGISSTFSNFYASEEGITPPLYAHGGEVGYFEDEPIVYVFGGRNSSNQGNGNDYIDTVRWIVPSEDEAESGNGYTELGLYLSPVFDLLTTATPVTMTWTGIMTDTNTDIELSFRVADNRTALFSQPWSSVDANPGSPRYSQLGNPVLNTAPITQALQGRYFQYQARLRSGLEGNTRVTPVLKQVTVFADLIGFPSLMVEEGSMTSVIDGPRVAVVNKLPDGATGTVLDANISGQGTFFVDMYLFEPGTTVVTPTLDPGGTGAARPGEAYVEINKSALPAGASYTIPPNAWMETCDTPPDCPAANWRRLFSKRGTWTIIVMVDSTNLVQEADRYDDPWEADNFYRFTFESQGSGFYLPIIYNRAP